MRKKVNVDSSSLITALEILYARHLIRQYLNKRYCNNKDSKKHLTGNSGCDTIHKDQNPNPLQAPGGAEKNGQKIGGQFISPNSALGKSVSGESGDKGNSGSASQGSKTPSTKQTNPVNPATSQQPGQKTQTQQQPRNNFPIRYAYTPQEMASNTAKELLDARVNKGQYNITTVLPWKLTKHFHGTRAYWDNWYRGQYKTYFTIPRAEVEKNLPDWVAKGNPVRFKDGSIRVIYEHPTPVGNAYIYDDQGKPQAHVPTRYVGIIIEQDGIHGFPMWESSAVKDIKKNRAQDRIVEYKRKQAQAQSTN